MADRDVLRAYASAERHAPSIGAQRVVRELRRCHVKFGKVTPSVEGMAERAGVSTATVKRATRWLRDAGWLRVVTRRAHCRGDGTWHRSQTNLYLLFWPTAPARHAWSHRGITRDPSTSFSAVGTARAAAVPPAAAVVRPAAPVAVVSEPVLAVTAWAGVSPDDRRAAARAALAAGQAAADRGPEP